MKNEKHDPKDPNLLVHRSRQAYHYKKKKKELLDYGFKYLENEENDIYRIYLNPQPQGFPKYFKTDEEETEFLKTIFPDEVKRDLKRLEETKNNSDSSTH